MLELVCGPMVSRLISYYLLPPLPLTLTYLEVNFWGKKKTSEDGQQEACPQTCLGGAGNVRINKCSSCECAGCSAELWRTNCNGTSASPCEDSELDTSKASFRSPVTDPDSSLSVTSSLYLEQHVLHSLHSNTCCTHTTPASPLIGFLVRVRLVGVIVRVWQTIDSVHQLMRFYLLPLRP